MSLNFSDSPLKFLCSIGYTHKREQQQFYFVKTGLNNELTDLFCFHLAHQTLTLFVKEI